MPKYDGAMIYSECLTTCQEQFCKYIVNENKTNIEAYVLAYPNMNHISKVAIEQKAKRLMKETKVLKRIEELQQIKKIRDNQITDKPFLILKNNPREFFIHELYDFIKDCKMENDRSNQIKGLESLAKLLNLYNEGSSITNNQLNQIIISSSDVSEAINSIHRLINKQ